MKPAAGGIPIRETRHSVSPKASSEQGGVNYTTIVDFDQFDPRLRWGMTAYVNITVN